MHLPPVPFHGLQELAEKWGTEPRLLVMWAIDGKIKLWAVVPPVQTGAARWVSGTVQINGSECLRLFNPGVESVPLQRIREQPDGQWEEITKPAGGFAIGVHDVIVLAAEAAKFAEEFGDKPIQNAADTPTTHKWQAGPGRPSAHNWEEMFQEVARMVHDEGVPKSLGDLARKLETWFMTRFNSAPDTRTIERKCAQLWKRISSNAA